MSTTKRVFWLLLGVAMIGAGLNHFLSTAMYVALMPDWIPLHRELVYASGVAEMGAGLLLLIPRTTRWGAWAIIATLVAVYPANIHHALQGGLDHPDLPESFANPTVAWVRLPFQLLFIAWAWWMTRPPYPGDRGDSPSP